MWQCMAELLDGNANLIFLGQYKIEDYLEGDSAHIRRLETINLPPNLIKHGYTLHLQIQLLLLVMA